MRVGRFLKLDRTWAAGDALHATFGLYVYLEPLNDWRPQYESSYALLYGPHLLVGLGVGEQVLSGSPRDVRRWTNVTRCMPEEPEEGSEPSATSAAWSQLSLAAPSLGGSHVRLRPLSSVVDETYSAYFRLT